MNSDELLREMERVAKAFQAKDQALEYDIQRVVNFLRSVVKLPASLVESLEKLLHDPASAVWMHQMPMPAKNYTPRPVEIDFIREKIAQARLSERSRGKNFIWVVPATGHHYLIETDAKTFTSLKEIETENDPNDWHGQTANILRLLGWKMLDTQSRSRSYRALKDGWTVLVTEFPIDTQENPATPGQRYPAGSVGHEAMASSGSEMVRLGHVIARHLIKHLSPEFGKAKSVASASQTYETGQIGN